MMDYYGVLGVSRTASAEEIRKAYRSLAFRFHPDVSRHPNAGSVFKEISQAYKALSDPARRAEYDSRFSGYPPASPPHPDPAYNPAYRWRGSGEPTVKELMLDHIHWVRWGSKLGFSLVLLLLTDFALPSRHAIEQVTKVENVYYLTRAGRVMVFDRVYQVTESGRRLEVTRLFDEARGDARVVVYLSRILGVPLRVQIESQDRSERFLGTVYGNFFFFPLLLGVIAIIGLFGPPRVDWRFNAGIASYLLILLCGIVLLYSVHRI